jgi:nucleotide-binding universal stress UspA family protein
MLRRSSEAGSVHSPFAAALEQNGRRVSDVIVDEATRWRADLVVLDTHGRRGIEHLLLGSVAEAVARTAPTSVLLARTHQWLAS